MRAWLPGVTLVLVCIFGVAHADDRLTLGYLASRPIAGVSSSLQNTVAARWDRVIAPAIEIGLGFEVGASTGSEHLARVALLPGIALVTRRGSLELRLEEQGGWQLVQGHVTLDGIPFAGTETRSFHDELAAAAGAMLTTNVELRGRLGIAIDGLYPVGAHSLRVSPLIGIELIGHR